jgi:hypothetical protein
MAKSPFELRFDALRLAQDHLLQEYNAKVTAALAGAEEQDKIHLLKGINYPTTEDIMTCADTFRQFIDG